LTSTSNGLNFTTTAKALYISQRIHKTSGRKGRSEEASECAMHTYTWKILFYKLKMKHIDMYPESRQRTFRSFDHHQRSTVIKTKSIRNREISTLKPSSHMPPTLPASDNVQRSAPVGPRRILKLNSSPGPYSRRFSKWQIVGRRP